MISLGAGPSLLLAIDTLSALKACRGIVKKIGTQEAICVKRKSDPVWVSVPVCTGGLSFASLWAQGPRESHYRQAVICPFCLQPVSATSAHTPALTVEPEDSVGAAAPWDVPVTEKRINPTVVMARGCLFDLPG